MRETVLLYNFDSDRLPKVKRALLPLKFFLKTVSKEDFSQPIGVLAGIKGIEPVEEKYDGDGFNDEMIVMGGFTSAKIDALVRALNKNGIGKIALKAVITPTNMNWNSVELYKAVKADHDEMNKNN
ncbi:MAG: DUF3783 domain-containing protein [Clostridia bacterium]|nr:DUF3783 domain-containing protein [Clostridia bacterium]